MLGLSIQFEGVRNAPLLSAVGLAIALAMAAYGVYCLVRRRQVRTGLAGLAGGLLAAGAVLSATLGLPLESPAAAAAWLLILAAVVALAVALFYSAVYAYLGRQRVMVLLGLRAAAILALLLILFKPALSIPPAGRAAKPALAVVVDRSASMNAADSGDLPSRYKQAVQALAAQRARLEDNFRVTWLHAATKVQAVGEPDELDALEPAGEGTDGTDLAQAIHAAASAEGAELSAILLLSDGLHNAAADAVQAARESPAPVYAIGVGSENESAAGQRNVRLVSVHGPLEAVKNNVSTITAKLRLTGWANIPARVVLSENGRELANQQVLGEAAKPDAEVRLEWTPGEPPAGAEGPDLRKLRVVVQPNPAEAVADDNAAELHVLVTQPSVRVLYVEGTLRPEYKYLRRVFDSDPNVRLMALARVNENRFLAQGSIDGKTLTDLPRTDEDFALFDVIILGDLDRTFLTNDQLERLRRFVEEGKSLLMLGGRNSFGPGGYGGTPIEAVLPVLCGPRSQPQETTPFLPQLTAAGAASPVFAALGEHFHSPQARASAPLPELLGCVSVLQAKPAASVLAIHPSRTNAAGPLVVLAVQQFGKGRSAAFTADTTWQWYLRMRPQGGQSPYHRFWGQLIRYLAGVEKKQKQPAASVLARLEAGYLRQGEDLKLAAQVRDAEGQPCADATVTASLKPAGGGAQGKPIELTLQSSQAGAGLYELTDKASRSGTFTVSVQATGKDGQALGADELPLIVAPRSNETDRLARDTALLKAIAAARGGRFAELPALPDVIDQVIQRQQARSAPPPANRRVPLYNFVLLFLVFVGLLTAEWLLRRQWQLR